ncbi:P-loop containing nucleoside triphosphate hydrolase protein [Curvularia clavata]|uniref:P-loop containing nucleoside triphosphate hydrolase protein n=1 Tax=Curvularia clavata TaxID=95742 RepID=A0A9Q8ZC32_CURCL|nr:P-loop containing nucleoside triphosphate hydrolase protein [Curvularia clavata]
MSAIELPPLRSRSEEAARAEHNAQTLTHANANIAGYDESPAVQQVETDAPETKGAPQASFKNYLVCNLVGNFTNYFIPGSNVTRHEFEAEINKLALYILYLFIGKFAMSYISMLAIRISGMRISAALRLAYLRALFAQPVSVIDTVSPGKVANRITTSSNIVQLAISQHFATLFQSLAFTVGLYVVAFVKGWKLTLIASTGLPFILIVYGAMFPPFLRIHQITDKFQEEASAMAYEMFSSIRMIVAFGTESRLAKQHGVMLSKAASNEKRAAPLMGLTMSPAMVAMYGIFGITFWFGIKEYTKGRISSVGDITVVLFSVMMAVMNIGRVASPIVSIAKAATAATELFVTIDTSFPDTSGVKEPEVTGNANITFINVAFSYPSRPGVPILKGLDLTITAGKVTAIVGPSRWYDLLGTTATAKKIDETEIPSSSTMASSPIEAGYDNTNKKSKKGKAGEEEGPKQDLGPNTCTGSLSVGRTNLRNVDVRWWRSQIGMVQQEPFLFNDTIYNNIVFGLCGTHYEGLSKDEKKIMVDEACREACAEEFISRLPQGLDTLVGESGIKLSGGQRQRIAIARSIIKRPPILILDEATSAIDVRTERIVQEALDRVSKNRTTIVIAHRLSTIKRADSIVVLRQGQLVEQGTHEELLKNGDGVYYGLVHAQELEMDAEDDDSHSSSLENIKMNDTKEDIASSGFEGHASKEDSTYQNVGLFHSLGRLVVEQRHHWILYSVCCIGILGAGAVYPLQAYIFARIINVFTLTSPELVKQGNFWAGMFGVLAGGVGLSYYLLGAASHLISVELTRTYRSEYLSNMIRKPILFFDDKVHSPGSLTSRLSSDSQQVQQLLSMEMSMALIACTNLLGCTIIAFVYGWKLSLVGLFAALPLILGAGHVRTRLEIQLEAENAKVFEDSSQFATEAVAGFRTVLSLLMEPMIRSRYDKLLKGHVVEALAKAKYGTIIFAASDSLELACMSLTFWYGGKLLASREYDLVQFFIVYMAIIQGATAAGIWFSFTPSMAQATGAANRILSMRPTSTDPSSYSPLPHSDEGVGIEFQHVSFKYQSRDVPVLSNLNLQILPGQVAALVGSSGSGKSTTLSLLERFYDASSGHILYNGQDITTFSPAEYRKQMSLVSQEPTLYQGSIRENISLSVESASDDDIKQACRDAQIHDFITSLPEGYETRLGPKGMSLSGGQKQRISLARALLRKPKILLLDEATSSLDSESEKYVQEAIERAAGEGDRTVIIVAHRLATIQKADVIFVLGSGKVLEKGDHQTLLRKKGVYWQMYLSFLPSEPRQPPLPPPIRIPALHQCIRRWHSLRPIIQIPQRTLRNFCECLFSEICLVARHNDVVKRGEAHEQIVMDDVTRMVFVEERVLALVNVEG